MTQFLQLEYTTDIMADQIFKKLEEHDEQLEIIASTVLDNKERLDKISDVVVDKKERLDSIEERMATKDDTNKIMSTLDELVGLAKQKDEELTSMSENVKRNTSAIEKIKPLVGLEVS